jgi:hypothetical protein
MSSAEDGQGSEPEVRPNRQNRDSDVGYGRPPRAHQFKPGQSGNPTGRPRGAKSEATMLRENSLRARLRSDREAVRGGSRSWKVSF